MLDAPRERLRQRIKQMSPAEQPQVMWDLANRTDMPIGHAYGSL